MNVYVRELSRHLGARGAAIDVFTRRQDSRTPEIVEFGENARVIHLEAGPTRSMDKYRVLDYLPQFIDGVEDFAERTGRQYRLLHSHYWLSSPVATAFARRWGVPLVTMFHTLGQIKNRVSQNGGEREHAARIEIEREAMAASDLIVAASPTDREQMVDYYGASTARIRVVPEGVDTVAFHPYPSEMARALLGMGPEKQVLFVGRIQALKGIDLLLRAFARLLEGWEGRPLPRLTLVGGRPRLGGSDPEAVELGRLRELARELGVAGRVSFHGAVPHHQLPMYYAAADVLVMPSTYESFGLVALEAMACGTPVVASRVGGLQWTVRDGETGFLVGRRSPEQFASAVGSILRDDQLRARMAAAAVQVAARYSWQEVADRILGLYAELVPAAAALG